MAIKLKDKKAPDIRVIFLLLVFIGLPIIVFISWMMANDEVGTILKMVMIAISAIAVTAIYRVIRYVFTVKRDKSKMKFSTYILIQSISLIITLFIIWTIVIIMTYIKI